VPPGPVQERTKLLSVVNEETTSDPDRLLLPLQSPDAVQLVASELDQLKVVDPPEDTLVGDAVKLTTGTAAAFTVTVTESLIVPPGPVQERTKLLSPVNEETPSDPDRPFVPLQSPEEVQLSEFELDQFNVVPPLYSTLVESAHRDTTG
jgi:hypothetical protein